MRGEDLGEGKKAQGLIHSFLLRGKLVKVETGWIKSPDLYLPIQKHTNRVIDLTSFPFPPLIGDGVVTKLRGVSVGVKTADCAPVVAIGSEWIGVAHVGWRGLRSGILDRFIEVLSLKEKLEDLFLFIGPCAKGCCYEVGREFEDMFPDYLEERDGKLFLDLEEAVLKELKKLGVRSMGTLGRCTICSEELPSHRRERSPDRILTSVRIL